MDLSLVLGLVFSLGLCGWTAAARSRAGDKPGIIVSSDEIEDGETVVVTCLVPIDYSGGDCRLFRERAWQPFRVQTTRTWSCDFHLTSQELLGKHLVGSRVYLQCDYRIQQYTSALSDIRGVTVWGSSPRPSLSVSQRFLSPDDSVEVTCSPPLRSVSSCQFYRDQIYLDDGSCSRNLTGKQLAVWEKRTVLLPVNMSCRYHPEENLHIRSEASDHHLLFVVDVRQVSSSVDCKVSVDDDQLAAFGRGSWTFGGTGGPTVTVQVTNSSLTTNNTCNHT